MKEKTEYRIVIRTQSDAKKEGCWNGWSQSTLFKNRIERDRKFDEMKKILGRKELIGFGGLILLGEEIHSIWKNDWRFKKMPLLGWVSSD